VGSGICASVVAAGAKPGHTFETQALSVPTTCPWLPALHVGLLLPKAHWRIADHLTWRLSGFNHCLVKVAIAFFTLVCFFFFPSSS